MSKYVKKPIIIEAFRMGIDYIPDWFMDEVTNNNIILREEGGRTYSEIKTLEGTMRADYGDYVILGVNKEIYPCKADIFDKTYNPVNEEKTEKEYLIDLFNDAIVNNKKIIVYTMFDKETIESCIYYNNLDKVLAEFKQGFDDDLKSLGGICEIVEAVSVDDLSNYFSGDSQAYISNRIYEKTGIRI